MELYFDSIGRQRQCVEFDVTQEIRLNPKPARVTVYDYYETSKFPFFYTLLSAGPRDTYLLVLQQIPSLSSGPRVIKNFSCSTELSMKI